MIGILLGLLGLVALAGSSSTPKTSTRSSAPPPPPAPLQWSHEGYAADLTPWGSGWRWRVSYEHATGATLASGWTATLDEARAAAHAWIDEAIELGPPELASQIRRGLMIGNDCDGITIVRVDEWISWAAPKMPRPDASVDPEAFLLGLFGELFPECQLEAPTVRGKPWDRAVSEFAVALERAAAGELLDVAAPEEILAARAVGLSVPRRQGSADWYTAHDHRWAIVVDPHPSGSGWRWRVWQDRRTGEPIAERPAPSRDAATRAARAWIEARPMTE